MRGYPEAASWEVLARVIPQSARGPQMALLDVTPRGSALVDEGMQTLDILSTPPKTTFNGPVALLVGHDTQSQAEHLTSFFRDSKRGKIVGGQTSGANGNITGAQLPGGYAITFTGMHIAHQNGERFFGIGHKPDVLVEPSPQDFRDHRDAVVLKAIDVLGSD
jgi:C-terminal processing protease CtpA/Prc